jgi:hypothetical protein
MPHGSGTSRCAPCACDSSGDPIRRTDGEFLQVAWGEAHVRFVGKIERRVFRAARLKHSRMIAVRWRRDITPETLLRGLLEIAAELGGVA